MTSDASKELFRAQIGEICSQSGVPAHEAFPRWICQNILGITDEAKIDEAVSIGGKNDFGVDIFHSDDTGDITEQYICWFQARFSDSLDYRITRDDLESFASTLGHLRNRPDTANHTFRQKSSEFRKMTAIHPRIRKRMIFAATGRPNAQANELINDPRWKSEKIGDPNVSFEILDLDGILSRMTITRTPLLTMRFDADVMQRTDRTTGRKSIIGYIRAEDLVRLSREHSESLFLENPRQTLGKTAPTHKAITNTLNDPAARSRFWKLNNGITATCISLDATDDPTTYGIDNLKIVNGRQTTFTLENATMPIDDVLLSMTIHEVADDEERNQISEATNTQNPIKPVDLITNYPEITELVLQCRHRFRDFYFERQSKGFDSVAAPTRNRVTRRRVLEKSSAARAYYAYAIDPNDAILPEKVLFSAAGAANYYDRIFKDRSMEELVMPHIFLQALNELHRKWCRELRDEQSDELSRKKGIISKDIVKYYILRFIYESMRDVDGSKSQDVTNTIIEKFRVLKGADPMPSEFLDTAQAAYDAFMTCFDLIRDETWPPELLKRISGKDYREDESDVPSPFEIASVLRDRGDKLLPRLLRVRSHMINQIGDGVQSRIRRIGSGLQPGVQ